MASDSDGEEDFVTYGTPLEPLEEGIETFIANISPLVNVVLT